MTNEKQSIVFFGSGPVAAESLRQISGEFNIECIITKPSTIKEMSFIEGVPVRSVTNKCELDELVSASSFSSEVGVLIDFGIIVGQTTIDSFSRGIVNSHFSLLPELRGPDPISFAILEGKTVTGVSLMLLVQGMDEGPLIAQSDIEVTREETTPSLTDKLINLSSQMLISMLPLWVKGEVDATDQDKCTILRNSTPTYTRKLSKADGQLDWTKEATILDREVRSLSRLAKI